MITCHDYNPCPPYCARLLSPQVTQEPESLSSPGTGSQGRARNVTLSCDPISGHVGLYWYQQTVGQGPEFLVYFQNRDLLDKSGMTNNRDLLDKSGMTPLPRGTRGPAPLCRSSVRSRGTRRCTSVPAVSAQWGTVASFLFTNLRFLSPCRSWSPYTGCSLFFIPRWKEVDLDISCPLGRKGH